MSKKALIVLTNFILIIIWMVCVFYFSDRTKEETNEATKFVTQTVVNTLHDKKLPEEKEKLIEKYEPYIESAAHFLLYCIGGMLIYCFVTLIEKNTNQDRLNVYKYPKTFTVLLGIVCACIDEIYQIFVPGRSCQVADVMFNSVGIIVGCFTAVIVVYMVKGPKQLNSYKYID